MAAPVNIPHQQHHHQQQQQQPTTPVRPPPIHIPTSPQPNLSSSPAQSPKNTMTAPIPISAVAIPNYIHRTASPVTRTSSPMITRTMSSGEARSNSNGGGTLTLGSDLNIDLQKMFDQYVGNAPQPRVLTLLGKTQNEEEDLYEEFFVEQRTVAGLQAAFELTHPEVAGKITQIVKLLPDSTKVRIKADQSVESLKENNKLIFYIN